MNATLPAGPRLPPLAQSLKWTFRPTEYMAECRRRYGTVFTIRLAGWPPFVFLADPALIKDVFTGDPEELRAGEANGILKVILGEHSLLLLDGERHRRERKLMLPPFHGERMTAYGSVIDEITEARLATWRPGSRFPLHPEMQSITLDVILRAVLGLEDGDRTRRLRDLLVRFLGFGDHPSLMLLLQRDGGIRFPWLQRIMGPAFPWSRFQVLKDEIRALLVGEIRERRAAARARDDVLSVLLEARDEDGEPMTSDQLHDEMLTLLVAGHETTATALTWAMHELLSNPALLNRLRHDEDGTYADAVSREALRLHPVVPVVGRVLKKPWRIGAHSLPAGTVVAPCIYLTQREPDLWPEADRFWPERFLERKVSPYEWLPFGGGVRRCIGMAFALYEMKRVLPKVAAQPLRHVSGYRPRMVRRGITFALSEGLPVEKAA